MWKNTDGTQLFTDGFDWREVNDDGAEVTFDFSAGRHEIHIANREPRTVLEHRTE